MRGRLPRSQHHADLIGDRNRKGEVEPPAQVVDSMRAPDHLNDTAKTEWVRITAILATMRILSPADQALIELYCIAFARWREADRHLAADGIILKAKRTGVPQLSPWNSVLNKSFDQMRRCIDQLGLSPVARARMRQQAENKDANRAIADRYMRNGSAEAPSD